MTAIVSMALGKRDIPHDPKPLPTTANFLLPSQGSGVSGSAEHRFYALAMTWQQALRVACVR